MTKCLKSLDEFDCQTLHDELFSKRYEGTCTWLFDDERYSDWLEDNSKQLLWISGKPGSGKSVLSAVLTQELVGHGHDDHNQVSSIAYFFCKGTDERLRTDSAILRNLLSQVLYQNPFTFQHFEKERDYQKHQENTRWTTGMLWRIFEQIWTDNTLGHMYFIIDAIGIL